MRPTKMLHLSRKRTGLLPSVYDMGSLVSGK